MLACCCMMWYLNLSDLEKLFGHSVHVNGRSPVCVLWCRCKCDSLKNDRLQYEHWCGFSPECVCMWRLRFCLFRNVRWHVGHSTEPVRFTLVWASMNAWKSIWDGWYLGWANMVGLFSSTCSSIITCGLSMVECSNDVLLSDESSSQGTWNVLESASVELALPFVCNKNTYGRYVRSVAKSGGNGRGLYSYLPSRIYYYSCPVRQFPFWSEYNWKSVWASSDRWLRFSLTDLTTTTTNRINITRISWSTGSRNRGATDDNSQTFDLQFPSHF